MTFVLWYIVIGLLCGCLLWSNFRAFAESQPGGVERLASPAYVAAYFLVSAIITPLFIYALVLLVGRLLLRFKRKLF